MALLRITQLATKQPPEKPQQSITLLHKYPSKVVQKNACVNHRLLNLLEFQRSKKHTMAIFTAFFDLRFSMKEMYRLHTSFVATSYKGLYCSYFLRICIILTDLPLRAQTGIFNFIGQLFAKLRHKSRETVNPYNNLPCVSTDPREQTSLVTTSSARLYIPSANLILQSFCHPDPSRNSNSSSKSTAKSPQQCSQKRRRKGAKVRERPCRRLGWRQFSRRI